MPSLAELYGKVDELPEGRSGTPFAHGAPREYTRKFLVEVKNKEMGPVAVCYHPGLPAPYSFYQSKTGIEYDLQSLMVKKSAVPRIIQDGGDWVQWIATCEYTSELGKMPVPDNPGYVGNPTSTTPQQPTGSASNPELESPELEWDWDIQNEAPGQDLDGEPFLNSALQAITPAPTVEVGYPVLVVTRNELYFDEKVAASYAFVTNTDHFMGWLPGQVLCMPPRAKKVYRGPLEYFRVTYRLRFAKKNWLRKYVDAGTARLQNTPGAPLQGQTVPIYRGSTAITQPILLDGKGQPQVPTVANPAKPVILYFRVYNRMPFAAVFMEGQGMKKPSTPPAPRL